MIYENVHTQRKSLNIPAVVQNWFATVCGINVTTLPILQDWLRFKVRHLSNDTHSLGITPCIIVSLHVWQTPAR
jgi:hypothetical protein